VCYWARRHFSHETASLGYVKSRHQRVLEAVQKKLENVTFYLAPVSCGARRGAVVEVLRYKPEGRGIDFRWCHWNFSLT
jgi:hypothetical protein